MKAFSLALDAAEASASAGRLHRQTAHALLMQHDAEQAEPHLRAAETLAADPAERSRLACLRANQAWERGEIDRAQTFAEQARELALVASADAREPVNETPSTVHYKHEGIATVEPPRSYT